MGVGDEATNIACDLFQPFTFCEEIFFWSREGWGGGGGSCRRLSFSFVHVYLEHISSTLNRPRRCHVSASASYSFLK